MSKTGLDFMNIDSAILSLNRTLNNTDNIIAIEDSIADLEDVLNESFNEFIPLRYYFFKFLPFSTKTIRPPIRVFLLSKSLCIEFPNLVNKKLNKSLFEFEKFLENSWQGRSKITYDGDYGTITYTIRLIDC